MPPELFLVPPVIILGAIAAIGLSRRKAKLRQWQAIAEQTGLELLSEPILIVVKVAGSYRGRALAMTPSGRPHWQRKSRAAGSGTMVTVEVSNPAELEVTMRPQDFVDKLLGLEDVEVGDEAFDRRFLIQSNHPDLARQVLGDAAIRQLLLGGEAYDVYVSRDKLEVYCDHWVKDVAHAVRLFDAAAHLADAVDRFPGRR